MFKINDVGEIEITFSNNQTYRHDVRSDAWVKMPQGYAERSSLTDGDDVTVEPNLSKYEGN